MNDQANYCIRGGGAGGDTGMYLEPLSGHPPSRINEHHKRPSLLTPTFASTIAPLLPHPTPHPLDKASCDYSPYSYSYSRSAAATVRKRPQESPTLPQERASREPNNGTRDFQEAPRIANWKYMHVANRNRIAKLK